MGNNSKIGYDNNFKDNLNVKSNKNLETVWKYS